MAFSRRDPHDRLPEFDDLPVSRPRQMQREIHASWSVQAGKAAFEKMKASGKYREQQPIGGNPTLLAFDPMGFQVMITQRQEP
jgi:hypothetical protein